MPRQRYRIPQYYNVPIILNAPGGPGTGVYLVGGRAQQTPAGLGYAALDERHGLWVAKRDETGLGWAFVDQYGRADVPIEHHLLRLLMPLCIRNGGPRRVNNHR